jgi:hypothetical protein
LLPDRGKRFFSSAPCPDGLGINQLPTQWVPEVMYLGCEPEHSHPSAARIMNAFSYTATTTLTSLWLHVNGFTTGWPFQQYSFLYGEIYFLFPN